MSELSYGEYLSNPQYEADNLSRQRFGQQLLLAFKQKNMSEGINGYQALHLHSRIREWVTTLPPAYGSVIIKVDLMNMMLSGDIETSCLAIMLGTPDDMSSPIHWCSPDRMNWLVGQMKKWLGWP